MAVTLPTRLEGIRAMSLHKAYKHDDPVEHSIKVKSYEYETYESKILRQLDEKNVQIHLPEEGDLFLMIKFGIGARYDLDNLVKPFQDILARRYGFKDNRITYLEVEKEVVERGQEYIEFQLGKRYIEGIFDRKEIRIFNKNNSDSDRI